MMCCECWPCLFFKQLESRECSVLNKEPNLIETNNFDNWEQIEKTLRYKKNYFLFTDELLQVVIQF
jgi:hypothetical protein